MIRSQILRAYNQTLELNLQVEHVIQRVRLEFSTKMVIEARHKMLESTAKMSSLLKTDLIGDDARRLRQESLKALDSYISHLETLHSVPKIDKDKLKAIGQKLVQIKELI